MLNSIRLQTLSIYLQPKSPKHRFIRKFSPDLLKRIHGKSYLSRLNKSVFAKRTLGASLLDQSVFGGLGNYLRSEVPFRSGLMHNRKLGALSKEERTLLARMIHDTTHRAYKTRGSHWTTNGFNKRKIWAGEEVNTDTFTFDREGKCCWICGGIIQKVQVAIDDCIVQKGCQQ